MFCSADMAPFGAPEQMQHILCGYLGSKVFPGWDQQRVPWVRGSLLSVMAPAAGGKPWAGLHREQKLFPGLSLMLCGLGQSICKCTRAAPTMCRALTRCWGVHRKPSAVYNPQRSSVCFYSELISLCKQMCLLECVFGGTDGEKTVGKPHRGWGQVRTRQTLNAGGLLEAQDPRRQQVCPRTSLQQVFVSLRHPVQGHSRVAPQPLSASDWGAPL